MGKKWKKGKLRAKPKAAVTLPQMVPTGSLVAPAANNTPTPQSEAEPTEAAVMAIMHDDDLLEYTSSAPSERRKSLFEHYRRQFEAARSAAERNTQVDTLRKALNPVPPKPRIGFINKLRETTKVGTVYISDWVVLGLIVAAALGFGGVALSEHLYTLAEVFFLFGIGLFIVKAIYDHRNHELNKPLMVFFIVLGSGTSLLLVGWVEWDRRHQRQRISVPEDSRQAIAEPATESRSEPPNAATNQSQDDLRAALRADGNRAIRLVTVRVAFKRKYSIEEIGHFRIMYEVASVTNRITPEFYLACQDYYDVNTFVDPKAKQFGYRWTVRYREPNGTYGPTESFRKGRGYGATTGLVSTTDEMEFSVDLYNQIPADKILEDLFGKYLYIFVTESLVNKISQVSLQVNNWELFSVKADRLISQDDKPIAPWFITLSKEEKAVPWRSVDVRFDEPLPPAVAERFKGHNPGWTWSLDPSGLHPRKMPEPELKVDPFKRAN
jgi:uncharacterized membrane protein YtjA (UPF0391 family)